MDENKIGNKEYLSFTSNYLDIPPLKIENHINLNANEYLGISNLIFEPTTSNSDFVIPKHNTNYDQKYELK